MQWWITLGKKSLPSSDVCRSEHSKQVWPSRRLPRPSLCCYPNIKVAVRSLSLITSTAPFVLQINYFRENIWVSAVSLSLHICRTSWQDTQNYTSNHNFFLLFSFWTSKVLGTNWTDLPKHATQIFELSSWRLKANICLGFDNVLWQCWGNLK